MTSADGRRYEVRNRVTLCRYGHSENKPFCDDTHKDPGWAMTEPAIEVIPGGPLRVTGLPLARLEKRDGGWVLGPSLARDDYLVCRCGTSATMPFCDAQAPYACFVEAPSTGGAPEPFGWEVPDPGDPAVALKPGGPVRIAGATPVTGASGAVLDPGRRVSLCRCGASRCQPLCDGSHKIVPVPDP